MRFFWEDQVSENVATKCVRVSCEDTAQSVTETLLEKFRPDMKLKTDSYALHEVHVNKGRYADVNYRVCKYERLNSVAPNALQTFR